MSETLGPREEMMISEQLSRIRHQYDVLTEAGIIACLAREKEIMNTEAKQTFLEFTIKTDFPNAIQKTFMVTQPQEYLDGARYVEPTVTDQSFDQEPELTTALWYNLKPQMENKLKGSRKVDGNIVVFQVLPDDTIEAGSFEVKHGKRRNDSLQKIVLPSELWRENDPFQLRPAELAIYSLLLPKQPQKGA